MKLLPILFSSQQNLAEEIKQFGNILTRKKEHSMAKRLYSYALEIVPQKSATLKRDLFSNRSYMNELLGNYSGALSDAKKCLEMFPKWPKVSVLSFLLDKKLITKSCH